MSSALYSPEYQKQQQALHEAGSYGITAQFYAPLITQILNPLEVTHLLDYGCGSKLGLYKGIRPNKKLTYQAYDPGVPEYAGDPIPAQMVACVDVLEHIEPEYLDSVLDHLQRLTEVVLFCTVHTSAARKTLTDGRNAHLTQQPMSWWLPKLFDRFDLQTIQVSGDHSFYVIAYAKSKIEAPNGEKLIGLR